MRDNFKPIPLDDIGFLKNFRGEVTIELKDVKTGEVETYHDHNLVTKALGYFLKQGGMSNPTAFNASIIRDSFIHYLLGGVLLLDTALTDAGGHDDEIVHVPAGVGMVGNGAIGAENNGSPTELGSYNSYESGWQQDGSFKMVWDYTTSQANGTIATVCLTSWWNGYAGIGNRTSLGTKTGNIPITNYNSAYSKGYSGAYLGYKGNAIQSLESIYDVTEWTVHEWAYPYTATDVRDNLGAREINTYTVQIPASLQHLTTYYESGGYRPWTFIQQYQSGDNVYIYLAPLNSSGAIVHLVKIVTYNLSSHTVTNVAEFNKSALGATKKWGLTDKWFIYSGHAIEFANPANEVEYTQNTFIDTVCYGESSDILYTNGSRIDMVLEEENPINGNGVLGICGHDTSNPVFYYAGANIQRDPRYIATIFNLDSPKTKSADKTMKVSYVIRFDEEES